MGFLCQEFSRGYIIDPFNEHVAKKGTNLSGNLHSNFRVIHIPPERDWLARPNLFLRKANTVLRFGDSFLPRRFQVVSRLSEY